MTKKKKCTICGKVKPIEEYNKNRSNKDGRENQCRACRSNRYKTWYWGMSPVDRAISNMADGIQKRTGPNGAYYGRVKNLLGDHAEIKAFIKANFADDIQKLLDEGKVPSIDRIDNNGHYEPGNLRVIDMRENSRLGRQYQLKKQRQEKRHQ